VRVRGGVDGYPGGAGLTAPGALMTTGVPGSCAWAATRTVRVVDPAGTVSVTCARPLGSVTAAAPVRRASGVGLPNAIGRPAAAAPEAAVTWAVTVVGRPMTSFAAPTCTWTVYGPARRRASAHAASTPRVLAPAVPAPRQCAATGSRPTIRSMAPAVSAVAAAPARPWRASRAAIAGPVRAVYGLFEATSVAGRLGCPPPGPDVTGPSANAGAPVAALGQDASTLVPRAPAHTIPAR
jgi:hypothetical protein